MILGVYRLYRNYNLNGVDFLYFLLFGAITLGLIYGIDFLYRMVKKRGKLN